MANLDNIKSMQDLDQENILGNICDLPDQVEKCWQDFEQIALPTPYINAKSVLILGMGGSAQGGGIIASLAQKTSSIPVEVLRDYDIPAWVDKNTLVIAVSYSGETEETLSAFSQAVKLTEKLITISTDGQLYSLGSQRKALHYKVVYGSQPRAALGYTLTAVLAIFKKLNLIEVTSDDIKEAVILMRALQKKIGAEIPERRNMAKILAQKIYNRFPVIYGAGNMAEVARRTKAQMNENAKTASFYEVFPELNHNALVGLDFPNEIRQKLFFLILQSKYDHPRTILRENITAQILEQKKLPYESIMMQPSGSQFAEIMQMITLTDFVSYYVAILNNIEPNPVGIIEVLKEKLAEEPFDFPRHRK